MGHLEVIKVASGSAVMIGVSSSTLQCQSALSADGDGLGYHANGLLEGYGASYGTGNTAIYYGPSYGTGDIISVVLDMTQKQLTFKKNGSCQGVAFNVKPGKQFCLAVSLRLGGSSVRIKSCEMFM